jgi:uncharacterized membrane protein
MRNRILSGWHFMRVLRLVAGVLVAVQGLLTHEWIIVIAGGLFALMSLFNTGCCGPCGCRVPPFAKRKTETTTNDPSLKKDG